MYAWVPPPGYVLACQSTLSAVFWAQIHRQLHVGRRQALLAVHDKGFWSSNPKLKVPPPLTKLPLPLTSRTQSLHDETGRCSPKEILGGSCYKYRTLLHMESRPILEDLETRGYFRVWLEELGCLGRRVPSDQRTMSSELS